MASYIRHLLAALLTLSVFAIMPTEAQAANGDAYSQEELDQLLAPIALYPDQLLTQILIAATYPLDVVEAARFVQQNPNLSSDALDQAIADINWDPSIQSLTAFPQVLAMLNGNLPWTRKLGDAFLADQPRVMNTVQALRRKAQAVGNLRSTPQQSVWTQDNEVIIEPAQQSAVYVPAYDPSVIYGPWWAPTYPPWFWYPPPQYGYAGAVITTGILFGMAWAISSDHWRWAKPDWRGNRINIDATNNRFWSRAGNLPPAPHSDWQHAPAHRRGVTYPNEATRDRFIKTNPEAVRARQDFRGHEFQQLQPSATRPEANLIRLRPDAAPYSSINVAPAAHVPSMLPRPVTTVLDPSISRQQTHQDAQRGHESRNSSGPTFTGGRQGSREPAAHRGNRSR